MSQDRTSQLDANDRPLHGPSAMITFKRSHFFLTLVPLAFVCGLAVGFLFWGQEKSSDEKSTRAVPEPVAQDVAPTEEAEVQRLNVSADDDPFLGPTKAKVTVVEFSDFECVYCVRFYKETLVPLLETYPDELRLVYRDFPLVNIHPNAKPAAEAAQCAFAQGKFWQFHNRLFENQGRLGESLYIEIASDIGLDTASFEQCYRSSAFSEEVSKDFEAARKLGVTGTPTFFINGRPLVGAQPLSAFIAVIEEELAASQQ